MSLWGEQGPLCNWGLETLEVGSKIDVVIDIFSCANQVVIGKTWPCLKPVRVHGVSSIEGATSVSLLQAVVRDTRGVVTLACEDWTKVLPLSTPCRSDLTQMIELCSGGGMGTYGFEEAGFNPVVAVDHSQPFCDLYKALHPSVQVICGSIGNSHTIADVHRACPNASFLMSGFSCQPFSTGGLQQGVGDSRANALHDSLVVAKALRCRVIVLECVPSAATNRYVRHQLETFCRDCHYQVSEVVLRLEDSWCTKRERWWAVLTDAFLGICPLRSLLEDMFPKLVKHVLPEPIARSPSEMQPLVLSADEMKTFVKFAPNLHALCLDRGSPCPTLLHSMGSQATGCPCGCRVAGFSESTLHSRGIYGFVIPTGAEVEIDGNHYPELRHPHPLEVAALSGIPLPFDLPSDMRLLLAAIGQQASPIHTVWVGSLIQAFLDRAYLGTTKVSPSGILTSFRNKMLLWSKHLFPPPEVELPVPEPAVQEPCPSVGVTPWRGLRHQGVALSCTVVDMSGVPFVLALQSGQESARELLAATGLVLGDSFRVFDCSSGTLLSDSDLVCGLCLWIESVASLLPPALPVSVPPTVDVSPTEPFTVAVPDSLVIGPLVHAEAEPVVPKDPWTDVLVAQQPPRQTSLGYDPLLPLGAVQLLALLPPKLRNLRDFVALHSNDMHTRDRLQVLKHQGLVWADDEFNWHISKMLYDTRRTTWEFIDPVVLRTFLDNPGSRILEDWLLGLPSMPNVLLGAAPVGGHWTPFVWTWTPSLLYVHTWDVASAPGLQLPHLHEAIRRLVGAANFTVNLAFRSFASDDSCGVCAARFLDHWIRGKPLPTELGEAQYLDGIARRLFSRYLADSVKIPRPWIWAAGLEPRAQARIEDLFKQHGVAPDQIASWVHLACQAMGVNAIQQAVTGSNPWRALKQLANQTRPVFQLVLPEELEMALSKKTSKPHPKAKPKAKGIVKSAARTKPVKPVALDPAKLTLDSTAFVGPKGQTLKQISISQIGPFAEGLVLCDVSDAFLKAGTTVTTQPLALLLLNCDASLLETALTWSSIRLVVRCKANNEPMLVPAVMVHLSTEYVQQKVDVNLQDIPQVEAACLKLVIFRDSVNCTWDEICQAPVRFLLNALEPLTACQVPSDQACTCSKWHATQSSPVEDPLLDVWRRQWLTTTYKATAPASADLFVVNVRCVAAQVKHLLPLSDRLGIYIEPRTLDSRQPLDSFQVIWMPRVDHAELCRVQ